MSKRKGGPEKVHAEFFVWLLYKRGAVYYADGRGSLPTLGRRSLGTGSREEARHALDALDRQMAVKEGLLSVSEFVARNSGDNRLPLAEGRRLYEEYVARPSIAHGVRPKTRQRYKAVFDKFLPFAETVSVGYWNQVNKDILSKYARWLEGEGYAHATQCLELSTVKQTHKWLIDEKYLPESCSFKYPLRKNHDSTRYCWTVEQFTAIIEHCRQSAELTWLGDLCFTLGHTGMRISEAANLRWSDIDLVEGRITLVDESRQAKTGGEKRTLKNHRSRSFPIHADLLPVLHRLPRTGKHVFAGPRGGRLKPDTVRRILIRDVLEPIKGRFPSAPGEEGFIDGRVHSFRHYFCSRCANSNTAERMVMTWLGHADAAMVRRYYHLDHDEARRQMARVSMTVSPETNVGPGQSPPSGGPTAAV
ncbi:tyrosine-type recombinase/integrase [Planctomyces sp. SH-PL14]|uniref:tyrosine-type recombinase/integrase n=1 Tax=Planctomyces sp. SH-PL14 TaxID=1632864 RepID=UPI00078B5624|nr:site-specific integrase [Planctomyces sp. SH-PL14]AMV19644.1 site-specific tyrosine recombinase XerD [Planctomyces sp. SH-PL14]